jgi:HlyD family secretion protein
MKRLLKWLVVLGILSGIVAAATPPIRGYLKQRNAPKFRVAKVKRGDLKWEVEATGKVEPVLKVTIGSFVSGPIVEIFADFNQKVEKGELLAKVDPRIYKAAVARDQAVLATAQAEVLRVQANLQQAINDEKRARDLLEINPDYISDTEMDQFRYARQALDAQLAVAEQTVKQAEASLRNSEANLAYTDITAPTAGIVIDRKIDTGQTLAAQFQTPELFVLAPDMDKRMWIHASVNESDVGHVLTAQAENRPVEFFVEAYDDTLFTGCIRQVRQNPTEDQNIVTYPVIVESPNPDMKLLPGMTANLSFEIEKREDVLLIPGAAIRFLPDAKHVREEDKKILEGVAEEEEEEDVLTERAAQERVEANRRRRKRHVWIKEGEKLRAVEIEYGLSDGRWYELVNGDLAEGQELVTGLENP